MDNVTDVSAFRRTVRLKPDTTYISYGVVAPCAGVFVSNDEPAKT